MPSEDQMTDGGLFEHGAVHPESLQADEEVVQETEETNEPSYVRVRLAGRDLEVTPDVAEALSEREKEFQRRLSEQGAELGTYRKLVAEQSAVREQTPTVDYDAMWYESPTRAMQQFKREIVNEVNAAYQGDQGAKEFWREFYRENPELVEASELVESVLTKNMVTWAELPVSEARAKLATEVRGRIQRLTKNFTPGTTKKLPNGPAKAEAAKGTPTKKEAKPLVDSEPKTLVDILRKRREARNKK